MNSAVVDFLVHGVLPHLHCLLLVALRCFEPCFDRAEQVVSHGLAPHMVPFQKSELSFYLALPPGKQFGKGSLRSKLVARRCLLRAVGAFSAYVYLRSMRAMDLVA